MARLFDDMAATYGIVNVVSSFGFCVRWRHQCVRLLPPFPPNAVVYDLTSGMGELWPTLSRRAAGRAAIRAVDISPEMCRRADVRRSNIADHADVEIVRANALASGLPEASADVIVSSFGLKTFSRQQQAVLAREVVRLLKPGGAFAFLEISEPPSPLLRAPYQFYIGRVIPLLGRLALSNPECYRMLGVYTAAFGNCHGFATHLRGDGLSVVEHAMFFGCATAVSGRRL